VFRLFFHNLMLAIFWADAITLVAVYFDYKSLVKR